MMNQKIKIATFSLLLAAGTFLFAAGNGPGNPEKPEHPPKGEHHQGPPIPDLTDQQKEEIKQIRLQAKQKNLPLQAQIQEKEAALKSLLISGNATEGQISAAVNEISDMKAQIQISRLTAKMAVRKLLSEEQRIVFDQFLLRDKPGHGQHGMGHPGRHQGPGKGMGPHGHPPHDAPDDAGDQ